MSVEEGERMTNPHMLKLIRYLEDNGYRYEDDVNMSTVYFSKMFNNTEWIFALTEPHDGNKKRWLLRAEEHTRFDKWGNASFEQFYDSVDEFIKCALIHLDNHINY